MTYVGAMLSRCLGGQRLDSLPVELGSATVVLGVGVIGGAAVLMEKGRLRRKMHELIAMRHEIAPVTENSTSCHEGFSGKHS